MAATGFTGFPASGPVERAGGTIRIGVIRHQKNVHLWYHALPGFQLWYGTREGLAMQVVLTINPSDSRTLQRQLFDQIRGLILENKLRSGDPVPASRALSEQLGVSRNTVMLAYEQLLSEGYIESRPNVGTFVSSSLPENGMSIILRAAGSEELQANDNNGDIHPLSSRVRAQIVISPNRGRFEQDFWIGRVDASTFPAK
jgi:GntR family transcriptional regulator/MocR family aminotransferase